MNKNLPKIPWLPLPKVHVPKLRLWINQKNFLP